MNRFIRNGLAAAFILISISQFSFVPVYGQSINTLPPQVIAWPDTVLVNGNIVTIDDHGLNASPGTLVEAMAIRDGRVLALGSNNEIDQMVGPQTYRIDLKGRTVIPGIIDTHSHLFDYADHPSRPKPDGLLPSNSGWDLMEDKNYQTWDQMVAAILAEVKRRAEIQPPGTRIYLQIPGGRGAGYDFNGDFILADIYLRESIDLSLADDEVLTPEELNAKPFSRAKLDEIAPDHYVHVRFRMDGIGNTKVIEHIKNLNYGPIMDPGVIETEQTGVTSNSFNRIMVGEVFEPFMNQVKWYKQENYLTAAMGITTWSSNIRSLSQVAAYRLLEANGELGNRFAYGPSAGTATQVLPSVLAEMGARFNPVDLRFGTDMMWYVGTGSKAADSSYPHMLTSLQEPEVEQVIKDREYSMENVGDMMENIDFYVSRGNRFSNTHVAGDGALDMVFEALERASLKGEMTLEEIRGKRHAIDHCAMNPRPDQIEELKYYNMIASCAPKYIHNISARILEDYGEEYLDWSVPMRGLIDAGVTAVLEIDQAIVRGLFWHIDLMVNREDLNGNVWAPRQRIDRVEALKASTIWATEYVGRTNDLGSLEPGKYADYLILNKDYFSIPSTMIKTVRPLMTVVGGNTVYLDTNYANELGTLPVGVQPTFAMEHIAIWEAEAAAENN